MKNKKNQKKKVKKSHKTDLTVEIKQKCSKVIFLKRKAVLCSSVDCDVMERGRVSLNLTMCHSRQQNMMNVQQLTAEVKDP